MTVAVLPIVMGRENEYSFRTIQRDRGVFFSQTLEEKYIAAIQAMLMEKYGAIPMGSFNSTRRRRDLSSLLQQGGVKHHEIYRSQLMMGVMQSVLGRVYREIAAPYLELSTHQYTDPFELALQVRRCDQAAGFLCRSISDDDLTVQISNAVSDRKGIFAKSAGMHWNFLISRDFFLRLFPTYEHRMGDKISSNIFPVHTRVTKTFMAVRILAGTIFGGEGMLGSAMGLPHVPYQISGRADFITRLVNGFTHEDRPEINTKNEPHADEWKFARVHVINAEGLRNLWASALDCGIIAVSLLALQDDALNLDWEFATPVQTHHEISRDIYFQKEHKILIRTSREEKSVKALLLLDDILKQLENYVSKAYVPEWCNVIVGEARRVVQLLQNGDKDGEARKMLDWLMKKWFIEKRADRDMVGSSILWDHPASCAIDLGYHRLDNEKLWLRICEEAEARDFDRILAPFGRPEEERFWHTGEPQDTRSHLFWFLMENPHMHEFVSVLDWEKISVLNESGYSENFYLDDPRRFNKEHLRVILSEGSDLSSPEGRSSFLRTLRRGARDSSTEHISYPV